MSILHLKEYEKVIEEKQDWEKGYFTLAQYFDTIIQVLYIQSIYLYPCLGLYLAFSIFIPVSLSLSVSVSASVSVSVSASVSLLYLSPCLRSPYMMANYLLRFSCRLRQRARNRPNSYLCQHI